MDNSTVSGQPSDAVPSGTSVTTGVPQGTPQGAGDAANLTLEDLQSKLDQLENDRRNQQSVYDRKIAEATRRNEELQKRLNEMQTSGMDDAQKIAFERDQLRAQIEELTAKQRVQDYANAFVTTFGITQDQLDLTDEQSVANSGWQAVVARMKELESKSSQTVNQPPVSQNTTKVITGSGGVPHTRPTMAQKAAEIAQRQGRSAISTEEFYDYMEKHPDEMNRWLTEE